MGQAVVAIVVPAPHVARGQVSSIFADDIYDDVFHEAHPVAMYSYCIDVVRSTEQYLRANPTTRSQVDDFLFHVAMSATSTALRKYQPSPSDLASATGLPEKTDFDRALRLVRDAFSYVADRRGNVLLDQVAKDPLTTRRLQDAVRQHIRTSPRS
jgi:hypothetical protein